MSVDPTKLEVANPTPASMTGQDALEYSLKIALDLGDPTEDVPEGNMSRTWYATVVRLTMDGWTKQQLADAFGASVTDITRIQHSPRFVKEFSVLAAQANNRSVSVRKRIEAMAHLSLDRDVEILSLPVSAADPRTTAIVARKSDEIKDRHGDMPKKIKQETDTTLHLTMSMIEDINTDADAIPVFDMEDVDSLIDGDPLEALYADAKHLLVEDTDADK